MQGTPPPAHTALYDALEWIAIPLASVIGAVLTWITLRKKIKPEIAVLSADAEKKRAEARQLDGSTVQLAWDRIDELQGIIDGLRTAQIIQSTEAQRKDRKIEDQENRIKLLELQVSQFISVNHLAPFKDEISD